MHSDFEFLPSFIGALLNFALDAFEATVLVRDALLGTGCGFSRNAPGASFRKRISDDLTPFVPAQSRFGRFLYEYISEFVGANLNKRACENALWHDLQMR